MTTEPLKPCPFCGGEAYETIDKLLDTRIGCNKCRFGCGAFQTEEEARTTWNTRTHPETKGEVDE